MAKTLSEDLRSRVIVAVDSGMSRRAAAERFGVGIATAVRWVHQWRTAGASSAKPKGGERRSHRIEAYKAVILAAIDAQVDITLVELAELLRREHCASFAPSTIWRFLGDVVIMDNLPAHRANCIREAIEAAPRRAASRDRACVRLLERARVAWDGHPQLIAITGRNIGGAHRMANTHGESSTAMPMPALCRAGPSGRPVNRCAKRNPLSASKKGSDSISVQSG